MYLYFHFQNNVQFVLFIKLILIKLFSLDRKLFCSYLCEVWVYISPTFSDIWKKKTLINS